MTRLQFEIELDNIDLSYDEKMKDFRQRLNDLDCRDADLTMQAGGNMRERIRITALLDELETARKKEILQLKKEFSLNEEK